MPPSFLPNIKTVHAVFLKSLHKRFIKVNLACDCREGHGL